MRTTRALAIAAILGIVFSFRASAKVVYDSETTNEWFAVDMSTLTTEVLQNSPWTPPSTDGEVVVQDKVIKLDTDFGNPLTYTPQGGDSTNVAIVAVEMTAAVNVSAPDLSPVPQAALCVIGTDTATNWVGLVGADNENGYKWETFETSAPVAGETYSVRIEFDQRQGQRKIRYRVGDTVLGTGWYSNPKTTDVTNIKSVSFSGVGDVSGLGGSNVVENAATFNGVGYATFDDALAAAKAPGSGWSDANPIVLYKNATYTAVTGTAYFDVKNDKTLTITGGIYTQNGNTYEIMANADCEALVDTTYYKTLDAALANGAGKTVTINKNLEGERTINVTSGLTLAINNKTITCAQLTVAENATLTLSGNLAVTTANISGAVAGDTLTVNGTLTGVNVAKLTFGNTATFAYGDAPIASTTTLTLGSMLTITGLDNAGIGTTVIDNVAVAGATLSMFAATVKEGAELAIDGNQLKIVKTEEPGVEIAIKIGDDTAGFDFTNGTINVNTTVKSGVSGTLTLTVVDFDGKVRAAVEKTVTDATKQVAFDLDDLTAGGTYSYMIAVSNAVGEVLGTAYGEFTAANWDDDIWFGADAAKGEEQRVVGGAWETEPSVDPADKVYVIEEDSVFNVAVEKQGQGSNRVTRVDAKVTFESLVDGDVDVPADEAISGFVATTDGWKALAKDAWVSLTGGPAPVAGKPYIVRAEVDFLSVTKRVRYLVSEDDGETFIPLSNGSAQWIDLVVQDKSLLAKVELQGSGKVAMFEARVADKALAKVGDVEYDTMEEALAAAGTNGEHEVTLLTNATIDPTKPGSYDIAPGGHHYMSGGTVSTDTINTKTIVITEPGQSPVVRPSTEEMNLVKTPDGAQYKDINSLRAFLERNGVEAYTADNATADGITAALKTIPENANGLALWQDYALGVDKDTSVAPVTIPTGDIDDGNITLAIPAVDPAKYSGDYGITYKVGETVAPDAPQSIKVPLGTGTYSIKAVFTPKTVPEQTVSGN